jgi:hypothetical protein
LVIIAIALVAPMVGAIYVATTLLVA